MPLVAPLHTQTEPGCQVSSSQARWNCHTIGQWWLWVRDLHSPQWFCFWSGKLAGSWATPLLQEERPCYISTSFPTKEIASVCRAATAVNLCPDSGNGGHLKLWMVHFTGREWTPCILWLWDSGHKPHNWEGQRVWLGPCECTWSDCGSSKHRAPSQRTQGTYI